MTSLSDRGVLQRAAGRALDVHRQALIEDLTPGGLGTFIGPVVAERQVSILQEPAKNWEFRTDFGAAIGPVGVDPKELKVGAHDATLGIFTALWWREDQQERQVVEAGIEDLEDYYIELVHSNPQLVWLKPEFTAAAPAGSLIVKGGPGQAKNAPVIFDSFYDSFVDEDQCWILAIFVTGYTLQQQLGV